MEQRRHFTVNFTRKGAKEAVEAVEGENSNKKRVGTNNNGYHTENPDFRRARKIIKLNKTYLKGEV